MTKKIQEYQSKDTQSKDPQFYEKINAEFNRISAEAKQAAQDLINLNNKHENK